MTAAKEIDLSQFEGHTEGPWTCPMWYGTDEDRAAQAKFNIPPVPALHNDGARSVMAGDARVGLVDCKVDYKRGKGHQTEIDTERDANGLLIAAAPQLLAELRQLREQNKAMAEALSDALSGWRYIRQVHGDLYGVGWNRVEEKAVAALNAGAAK